MCLKQFSLLIVKDLACKIVYVLQQAAAKGSYVDVYHDNLTHHTKSSIQDAFCSLPLAPASSSNLPLSPSDSLPSAQDFSNDDTTPVASVIATSPSTVQSKKFCLPDTWRPSIMYAIQAIDDGERRKRLTSDIRNEIVRDIVSSMYAFMTQPNKEFCTHV